MSLTRVVHHNMQVYLYCYDLSKGMAKTLSMQLLGKQVDAVWHSSVTFNNVEHTYGGGANTNGSSAIARTVPGSTHHGQPLRVIELGECHLPTDVIEEYLTSLENIYTAEKYDLFYHNCNNFSQDLAVFLVGCDIPDYIRSLPETVLNSPFGAMLRPQLERSMREVTEAPSVPAKVDNQAGQRDSVKRPVGVRNVQSLSELQRTISERSGIVFFTSATCPPCKALYPLYDSLALEAGSKLFFNKVDISVAREIAAMYSIRATPTFITFLKGEKENQWVGADPAQLRGNVSLLLQMANPAHPHSGLRLPLIRGSTSPVLFSKHPPLEKLSAKLNSKEQIIVKVKDFIQAREHSEKIPSLPQLSNFDKYLKVSLESLPPSVFFAAVDLLRLLLCDSRVGAFFSTSGFGTIQALLKRIDKLGTECPYPMRLCSLQALANLATNQIFITSVLQSDDQILSQMIGFLSEALLDDQNSAAAARVAASAVAYNLSLAHRKLSEADPSSGLPESDVLALVASLVEIIQGEKTSEEALRGEALALSLFVLDAPIDGEVLQLCKIIDAGESIRQKAEKCDNLFPKQKALLQELGEELLTKGLTG